MILLGIIAAAVLFVVVSASQSQPVARSHDPEPREDARVDDQLDMLTRYGTPDDAARLMAQGVDLTALGYHPPEQR